MAYWLEKYFDINTRTMPLFWRKIHTNTQFRMNWCTHNVHIFQEFSFSFRKIKTNGEEDDGKKGKNQTHQNKRIRKTITQISNCIYIYLCTYDCIIIFELWNFFHSRVNMPPVLLLLLLCCLFCFSFNNKMMKTILSSNWKLIYKWNRKKVNTRQFRGENGNILDKKKIGNFWNGPSLHHQAPFITYTQLYSLLLLLFLLLSIAILIGYSLCVCARVFLILLLLLLLIIHAQHLQ